MAEGWEQEGAVSVQSGRGSTVLALMAWVCLDTGGTGSAHPKYSLALLS